MWKKEEPTAPTPTPKSEAIPRSDRSTYSTSVPTERATIGRSITIRGEVTGDEDLLIQGRVDGSVDLEQHAVTVGAEGDVKASIVGRIVMVEGRVEGNIKADEQVVLRSSAWVQGDITAPRVVLEDGARFRGGIDMGETAAREKGNPRPNVGAQAKRPNEPGNESSPPLEGSGGKPKSTSDAVAEVAN